MRSEKGTPKHYDLREKVIPRRKIFDEATPKKNTSPIKSKMKKHVASSFQSPVSSAKTRTSRYYLRSSLLLCSPSPQRNTRCSLGKSAMMATPYRTPKLTSKINNLKLLDNKAMKPIWKQDMKGLLDVSWKICYLSSMTNFEYTIKNVRNIYEAVLRTKILEVGTYLNLDVKIITSSCLSQNPALSNALTITVSASSFQENEDEIIITIYKAWLISSSQCQSKRLAKVEWLPLMLYSGRENIHGIVTQWMQSSFGCFTTPKMLQQSTMLWISAVWSKELCSYKRHNRTNARLFYKYRVRNCLKMGDNIAISLTILRDNILKIYQVIKEKHETTIELVSEFHTIMQSFVSSITCIPSDLLRLYTLRTSCFSLDNHGSIRFICPVKIPSLLNHLTELLQEMLICNRFPETASDSDNSEELDILEDE